VKNSYGIKNFTRIANENFSADTTTLEGIETALKSWFCFAFNTTLNDERLLNMTLEELVVTHQMHRIKNNPQEVTEELDSEGQDYETWLKESMGEDYVTDDEMVKAMQEEEKEFQEKVRKKYPERVTTDFTQFQKG